MEIILTMTSSDLQLYISQAEDAVRSVVPEDTELLEGAPTYITEAESQEVVKEEGKDLEKSVKIKDDVRPAGDIVQLGKAETDWIHVQPGREGLKAVEAAGKALGHALNNIRNQARHQIGKKLITVRTLCTVCTGDQAEDLPPWVTVKKPDSSVIRLHLKHALRRK